MEDFLSPGETQRYQTRREQLERQGIPSELAWEIAAIPLADRAFDILRISERVSAEPIDAARVYARLGEESGINWIYEHLTQAAVANLWDRMAIGDIRCELLNLQRGVTEEILSGAPADLAAALDGFLAANAATLERVRGLQRQAAGSAVNPTSLAVITNRLRSLHEPAAAQSTRGVSRPLACSDAP